MLVELTELLAKNYTGDDFIERPVLLGQLPILVKEISLTTKLRCRICYLKGELTVRVKETMEEIIRAFEEV